MNIHLRLRLGFASALILLLGTGLISQYGLKRSSDDAVWVSHTYEVIAEVQRLSAAVQSSLSEFRGYGLWHTAPQRARFDEARQRVEGHFERLRHLTADNPNQQRKLDVLKPALDQLFGHQEASMFAHSSSGEQPGETAFTDAGEEQSFRQIEAVLQEFVKEENLLLGQRVNVSRKSSVDAAALLALGTLVGAAFFIISSIRADQELRRRERAERALREAQQALEARYQESTASLSNTTASLNVEASERQKAERGLRESEQRYRILFEDNPLPMEIFDPETLAYLDVNKAAQELYGYTREEFLQMTLRDTRPPEEVPALMEFLNTVKNAEAYSGTFLTRHKGGKVITIDVKVRTIQFGDRKARLKLVMDVTQHKHLETRLQQSAKIEAVGRLAGGIAHDFNNLLTLILGYGDDIASQLASDNPIRPQVLEIQMAAQRAANLTRQLLAFSRKQILKPQVLQLNSVVSDIARMLRRLVGEDVHISLHLDAALGQVQADRTQLEQVLVNLTVNARDAMPNGGQLVIESHNVEFDDHAAQLQGVNPGRYVVLVVSDTGCGMTQEVKARVFEPFFTTKEVGKGTGLGLSMVLGVVQQSGGTVTIYSEPGLGTTFKIYLPRLDGCEETEPVLDHSPHATHPIQAATILLVEDEPSLRALARNVLHRAGYTVFEAGNGKEALRVAGQFASPPDLLFTDVVMPEMSGLELAERLQEKWPELRIIYTSGYTDHALLERNALREDMPFLQKPYMPAAMLDQVASTLDKDKPTRVAEEESAEVRESLTV